MAPEGTKVRAKQIVEGDSVQIGRRWFLVENVRAIPLEGREYIADFLYKIDLIEENMFGKVPPNAGELSITIHKETLITRR